MEGNTNTVMFKYIFGRTNTWQISEVSVLKQSNILQEQKEQLLEITEKYHCDFLGYDDGCGLIDIGWEKAYPDYTTMHAFLAEVNQVFSQKTHIIEHYSCRKLRLRGFLLFCLENIILTLEHNNAEEWSEEIIL